MGFFSCSTHTCKRGPQGLPGRDGCEGEQGPMGPRGPTGVQGLMGPTGAQGLPGLSCSEAHCGATGERGPMGPVGPTGEQGLKGDAGDMGPVGPTGDMGPVGPTGAQGLAGDMGPVGPTGAQGLAGDMGPVGPTGAQGPAGAPGSDNLILPIGCDNVKSVYGQISKGVDGSYWAGSGPGWISADGPLTPAGSSIRITFDDSTFNTDAVVSALCEQSSLSSTDVPATTMARDVGSILIKPGSADTVAINFMANVCNLTV